MNGLAFLLGALVAAVCAGAAGYLLGSVRERGRAAAELRRDAEILRHAFESDMRDRAANAERWEELGEFAVCNNCGKANVDAPGACHFCGDRGGMQRVMAYGRKLEREEAGR